MMRTRLPRARASSGTRQKEIAARALEHRDADDQNDPFEQTPPIFYV
jgi:hypothetical protein